MRMCILIIRTNWNLESEELLAKKPRNDCAVTALIDEYEPVVNFRHVSCELVVN